MILRCDYNDTILQSINIKYRTVANNNMSITGNIHQLCIKQNPCRNSQKITNNNIEYKNIQNIFNTQLHITYDTIITLSIDAHATHLVTSCSYSAW